PTSCPRPNGNGACRRPPPSPTTARVTRRPATTPSPAAWCSHPRPRVRAARGDEARLTILCRSATVDAGRRRLRMRATVSLGRWFGVPVGANAGVLVILVLVGFALGVWHFPTLYPGQPAWGYVLAGSTAAV